MMHFVSVAALHAFLAKWLENLQLLDAKEPCTGLLFYTRHELTLCNIRFMYSLQTWCRNLV